MTATHAPRPANSNHSVCWLFPSVTLALAVFAAGIPAGAYAAELVRLTPENWSKFAPSGKEADRIYGDWVLQNELVICVIAQPAATRNANMTVRNVGWAIIDLTRRGAANDQLSAYYPGSLRHAFHSADRIRIEVDGAEMTADTSGPIRGSAIRIACDADAAANQPAATVTYSLRDGDPFVGIETTYSNPHASEVSVERTDTIRADKTFEFGIGEENQLFWADDEWFRQTYGVVAGEGEQVGRSGNRGVVIAFQRGGATSEKIAPGASSIWSRKLFPATNALEMAGIAARLRGQTVKDVRLAVRDKRGPVRAAKVTLLRDGAPIGSARTPANGTIAFASRPGDYQLKVEALGRPEWTGELAVAGNLERTIELGPCGYVQGRITRVGGGPIPCKVAFRGLGDTPTPDFGPDTAVTVKNLKYSHNGQFLQELGPGRYEAIISYGPEYDAVFREIEVQSGGVANLSAELARTVETHGWVSADFHSHSTPSGDNTCSQRARVLNLLCEHIEFAPCTEHNRIDTYVPHLKALKVEPLMATCSGIELTGQPLPLNHQNAFPLKLVPRTQDNGGPVTHENPLTQIERLALWDAGSEKLVQINHPNLVQMIGDRDLDGKPDGGFAGMLSFMDVVEVHPMQPILLAPNSPAFKESKWNAIFHWMQLLNLGYRVPGVVNTDAHYSFHDSGGLRNFVHSSTDDPSRIDAMEMVRESTAGHVVMSNGPFLEVSMRQGKSDKAVGPGDTLTLGGAEAPRVRIRVQCPNWFDVNRVQVFVNGRPIESANFTRRTHGDAFGGADARAVKFDREFDLPLASDSHVILVAAGEGLKLGPVMGPRLGEEMPIAVSNPIYVDVDGGGFRANGDLLDVPLPLDATPGLPIR